MQRSVIASLLLAYCAAADAQSITQILGSNGDGSHTLDKPAFVAVDGLANAYVVGQPTSNAFKITPSGTITQIVDSIGGV